MAAHFALYYPKTSKSRHCEERSNRTEVEALYKVALYSSRLLRSSAMTFF